MSYEAGKLSLEKAPEAKRRAVQLYEEALTRAIDAALLSRHVFPLHTSNGWKEQAGPILTLVG
jgi:hypothetical protein